MADLPTTLGNFANVFDIRTALLSLLVFLTVSWIVRSFLKKAKNLPPGPKAWPLIGCLPELLHVNWKSGGIDNACEQLCDTYGPVCNLALLFRLNIVLVSGYKAVSDLMTSSQFEQRQLFSNNDNPIELMRGAGVILSTGEVWREHRKFSSSVLRSFGVGRRSFEDQIATESEHLMKEISSLDGHPFDPSHLFCNAVSNIICSVVFGNRFEYDDPEFKQLLKSLEEILEVDGFVLLFAFAPKLVSYLSMIPFFPKGNLPAQIYLRQKILDITKEHRNTFDSDDMRDYIDVYLKEMQMKKEQGTPTCLSDIELLSVVYDFFGAGTETTSTALRWALLYMLKYPDVQKRVHEELDSVVGRDRLPRLSDKPNLPYTLAVINEIQRLASIIGRAVPRHASKDVDFQGSVVPKGSYLLPSLYSVSRDTSIWEDPEDFKPERFLDDEGELKKIPENLDFGAGKRACVGEQLARMELDIFFSHLMHQYSFQKPADMGDVNMQPKHSAGLLRPFPFSVCAVKRD